MLLLDRSACTRVFAVKVKNALTRLVSFAMFFVKTNHTQLVPIVITFVNSFRREHKDRFHKYFVKRG